MKAIRIVTGVSGTSSSRDWLEKVLYHLLDALYKINRDYLIEHRKTPPLYKSGVKYVREQGREDWQSIPEVMKTGQGDCEDLASWRAAELSIAGIPARTILKRRSVNGLSMYHVLVKTPRGIEDPSAILGMNESEQRCRV